MVTIFIGPENNRVYVYKGILCNASSFFEAAFKGDFKEGQEQSVSLASEV